MNRKRDELIQTEVAVLTAAAALRRRGTAEFHGFLIAKTMEGAEHGAPVGRGALYKALLRLEERGYLKSHWEDDENRSRGPRRRLYELAGEWQKALATAPVKAQRRQFKVSSVRS